MTGVDERSDCALRLLAENSLSCRGSDSCLNGQSEGGSFLVLLYAVTDYGGRGVRLVIGKRK